MEGLFQCTVADLLQDLSAALVHGDDFTDQLRRLRCGMRPEAPMLRVGMTLMCKESSDVGVASHPRSSHQLPSVMLVCFWHGQACLLNLLQHPSLSLYAFLSFPFLFLMSFIPFSVLPMATPFSVLCSSFWFGWRKKNQFERKGCSTWLTASRVHPEHGVCSIQPNVCEQLKLEVLVPAR